jgi:RNA polymerase sigma-70 factor (ECF subfamily)
MSATDFPGDEDLIVRIGSGDRDAFAELYRRRRSDVFRFAVFMSGSTATADDVTQDVFVEIIHHAKRYRAGRSGVKPWLFGIARNHIRRVHQRVRPALSLSDAEQAEPRHLMVEDDLVAGLARREDVNALRRAVLELPVAYREAIVLCDLHELSYVDAAAALNCAIGTVRSRLHRGRTLLAERLRETNHSWFHAPLARGTP